MLQLTLLIATVETERKLIFQGFFVHINRLRVDDIKVAWYTVAFPLSVIFPSLKN